MEEQVKVAREAMLGLAADGKEWKRVHYDAKKSRVMIDRREVYHHNNAKRPYSMWRCAIELPASVAEIEQWVTDATKLKQWNPVLHEVKVLSKVDKTTDIVSYLFQEMAGGLVSPRQFVVLRHKESLNEGRLLLAVGQDPPANAPTDTGWVRGWTGPSGFLLQPVKAGCRMLWIINSDSRLPKFFPKTVADRAFIKLIRTMMRNLKALANPKPQPNPK